jgi:hypothetical protein
MPSNLPTNFLTLPRELRQNILLENLDMTITLTCDTWIEWAQERMKKEEWIANVRKACSDPQVQADIDYVARKYEKKIAEAWEVMSDWTYYI